MSTSFCLQCCTLRWSSEWLQRRWQGWSGCKKLLLSLSWNALSRFDSCSDQPMLVWEQKCMSSQESVCLLSQETCMNQTSTTLTLQELLSEDAPPKLIDHWNPSWLHVSQLTLTMYTYVDFRNKLCLRDDVQPNSLLPLSMKASLNSVYPIDCWRITAAECSLSFVLLQLLHASYTKHNYCMQVAWTAGKAQPQIEHVAASWLSLPMLCIIAWHVTANRWFRIRVISEKII